MKYQDKFNEVLLPLLEERLFFGARAVPRFEKYVPSISSPVILFLIKSGSHLLSHAVSSIVPSAAPGLTIVFGMGTGVSPKRIATGKIVY